MNKITTSIFGAAIITGCVAGALWDAPRLTAQQLSGWAPAIVSIAAPAGANSGEPQLTVMAAPGVCLWMADARVRTAVTGAQTQRAALFRAHDAARTVDARRGAAAGDEQADGVDAVGAAA